MFRQTSSIVITLLTVAFLSIAVAAEKPTTPLSLHPDNPHYFLWRDAPTVLITSGEHYGALMNLDFDYRAYFGELAKHGLNHTRVFSGTYREIPSSFGISENPLAPRQGRYIGPWARSTEVGNADGDMKFDLTAWDTGYFDRLENLMAEAQVRGIVVEMTLFCAFYDDALWEASPMNIANNINGVGDCSRLAPLKLSHNDLTEVQLAFTRKMVIEMNRFDNFYFEVCNEPYMQDEFYEWEKRIIEVIIATERDLPNKHLISQNIANKWKKVENPNPAVSILNFHYAFPPDTIAMNYPLNLVIGDNETGFSGSDDLHYRVEGWRFLMAGGALYNSLDYSFTPTHPGGTLRDYQSPGGGTLELRRQLGILKTFIDRLDFVTMTPDTSFITGVSPQMHYQALVTPGQTYAAFLHIPLAGTVPQDRMKPISVVLEVALPKGSYEIEWRDTKTGAIAKEERLEHEDTHLQLSSPSFVADIALRIDRK